MRQAIRVYAIVALVIAVALLAVWWTLPDGVAQGQSWTALLDVIVGGQFWVLLVVPLGVLAASDAGHEGRHGWLAAFVVLIVLAPIIARIEPLTISIQRLLNPPCLGGPPCDPGANGPSQMLYLIEWTAALLPVPLAALIYSLAPGRHTPRTAPAAAGSGGQRRAAAGSGMRRVIVVCAAVGLGVMGALGFLVNSDFILTRFASGTVAHILFIGGLRQMLDQVWFALLDALPIAVANLALAYAVRTGQRGWSVGWIVIVALAMLVANFFALAAAVLISAPNSAVARGLVAAQPQMQVISAVVPVVVLLVALIYALTRRPAPQSQAAAFAA